MSYLHVLNGDATLTLFRQSKLEGEVVVCREMMSEGKVKYTKDAAVFFESRAKHLEYHYGIDKQTYYTNVVQELEKIKISGSSYDEIILWFEYDLFCQINMLFVIHYLKNNLSPLPVISVADLPHHPDIAGFPTLMQQRVALTDADLQLADDAWDAYCLHTPQALETIAQMPPGNLKHLPAAIQAHLHRFPDINSGLSTIELFFLQKLALGNYRWYDLYISFWDEQKIYGFGDFQLDILKQRMIAAGVIEEDAQMLRITSLGREILAGEENYLVYTPLQHRWLGGVRLANCPWRWNPATQSTTSI
ncbi:hypothetical protein ECE50_024635 [Chitinophaga sp. Mgbs1]|uniref:DUF1835 domain-containing protein n=1 Tax=Chitinophaga solisilvae TaxID=1233460 RepID=A0A433WBE1_9BACT|nr:hypothetical protein [Chitinophaga solisilvae]